jgi:hypothetical protein
MRGQLSEFVQHSATAKGDEAAAPDRAAAVLRGTLSTTRAPPTPLPTFSRARARPEESSGSSGTPTTRALAATTRAPAITSTRSPGCSRRAAAASAIRTGTRTSASRCEEGEAAGTGRPAGAAATGRGVAPFAAETAKAAAATARPTAIGPRRRRRVRRSRRLPLRPPARMGGKSGISQRGGVYGAGVVSGGRERRSESIAVRGVGPAKGEGKGTDERMGKHRLARGSAGCESAGAPTIAHVTDSVPGPCGQLGGCG